MQQPKGNFRQVRRLPDSIDAYKCHRVGGTLLACIGKRARKLSSDGEKDIGRRLWREDPGDRV